ncbi:MAG: hypothetical protein ACRD4P_14920 [Bryobacteraceae bacterium]
MDAKITVYMRREPTMLCFFIVFLLMASLARAQGITYVVLWFDTEDYIEPAADDAALRIATDLSQMGVHATFKVVGEKARTLQRRGRKDVIEALSKHCIGYHSNWHSIQPVPAVYEQHLGFLEGADEFERRERSGFEDVGRIFGKIPVCYGQPGSSWAPQTNLALRRMGIHVYLDSGTQVGLDDQPMWYGGLLYVYNMGSYQIRAELDRQTPIAQTFQEFDVAVRHFAESGGGMISTYYHPTEFVTTEFWDAVNFSNGATVERDKWVRPKRRTPEDTERCYQILRRYVEHAKHTPGVRFVTAEDLLRLYSNPPTPHASSATLARHFQQGINFISVDSGDLSAADILLQLLGLPPQYVDGPTHRGVTTYNDATIPNYVFERAANDVKSFIAANHRLPSEVFLGARTLSLADFAATLAAHMLSPGQVRVAHGKLDFEQYVSTDPVGSFKWPIHPAGFSAPELLDMARLQAWTLKPARLR